MARTIPRSASSRAISAGAVIPRGAEVRRTNGSLRPETPGWPRRSRGRFRRHRCGCCARASRPTAARLICQKQPLFVAGADEVGERELVDTVGRGRGFAPKAPQRAVTEFVGELEALDQAVTQVVVIGEVSMALEAVPQAVDRARKWHGLHAHPSASHLMPAGSPPGSPAMRPRPARHPVRPPAPDPACRPPPCRPPPRSPPAPGSPHRTGPTHRC